MARSLSSCTYIGLRDNPGSDASHNGGGDSKVKEALASPERAAALVALGIVPCESGPHGLVQSDSHGTRKVHTRIGRYITESD